MINVRKKGHDYEREVVNQLKGVFIYAERTQEGDSLDRKGVDLKEVGNLLIQCKRGRRYSPLNKIEEITVSKGIPCLITRGDNKRSIACLYLDDFIKILRDIGVVYD